jgi:predicted RNase H-like nuclease (RuvC/YqgF family)
MKKLINITATLFVVYEVFKFILKVPILLVLLTPIIMYMLNVASFIIKGEIKSMRKQAIQDNKDKMKEDDKRQKEEKVNEKKNKIEHYENVIKPMYEQGKTLFNSLMKSKKIKKKQLEEFLKLINSHLGQHVNFYHNYKFETATKEVYVKMKNYNLNEYDWEDIINYLQEIEKQSA